MGLILGHLLTPVDYLRIRASSKAAYDWWIPLAFSIALCVFFWIIPGEVKVLGPDGLVQTVMGLLQTLTGFYIAALAAVATFARPEIDKPLAGSPATLETNRYGETQVLTLSRRRFVCYLFGYLSFLCLTIYSVSTVASFATGAIEILSGIYGYDILRLVSILGYVFLVMQLLTITLLGLHYLTDRLHR